MVSTIGHTVSKVSCYSLYGDVRSPRKVQIELPNKRALIVFYRLLEENHLYKQKSMEFSHVDFSLMETEDLEILLKIAQIESWCWAPLLWTRRCFFFAGIVETL